MSFEFDRGRAALTAPRTIAIDDAIRERAAAQVVIVEPAWTPIPPRISYSQAGGGAADHEGASAKHLLSDRR